MSPAVAQSQKRRAPLGEFERAFVAQKRAIRASWDAIAAMLDRPVLDVRAAYDPDYRAAGFALPAVSSAAPRARAVVVCGRRMPVEDLSAEELIVLKALAQGELVTTASLRERLSSGEGELVGKELARRILYRLDPRLPEPLRVVRMGEDGWVIAARPGAPRARPIERPAADAPDPFGLKLSPICVAVLELLVAAKGALVGGEQLARAPLAIGGQPLSPDGVRTRISMINAALPTGARAVAERGCGYRLTGARLVVRAAGADGEQSETGGLVE